jgi:predicted acyl esterase
MRRLGLILAVAVGLPLAALPGGAAFTDACSQAEFDCTEHTAMVEMTDGVDLDASLYVPKEPVPTDNGKIPVIVRQHGGGSNKDNDYDLGYGLEYVKTGKFALLMYSHRGHGSSEGFFDFFGTRTTLDFSEILDWAATQSTVVDTNNVGVSGYSQGGGESLLAAENDARVKAAAVGNTFDSLNRALNPNDCFKFSFATGIFALAYKGSASKTQDELAVRWGAQLYTDTEDEPLGPMPSTTDDLAARSPLTYVHEDLTRPMYKRGLQIPVFWSNSWEDQLFPADHPQQVLADLKLRGLPVHYWFASGGHAAGPNDPGDQTGKEAAMRDWMEEFLRGADHGYKPGDAAPVDEVDYVRRVAPYADEPGHWVHDTAPAWPVPSTPHVYYAGAGGTLEPAPQSDGDLATIVNDAASANVANDAITHEVPRQIDDGIRSHGGPATSLHTAPDGVPESVNPLDTATFAAGSLASSTPTYVGAPEAQVHYRTTARHALQFDVKLWQSFPGGARRLVWRGCTSIGNIPESGEGTATFQLWPNAVRLGEQNDTLMMTISTVDFPTFKPDTEPHATTLLAGTLVSLPAV